MTLNLLLLAGTGTRGNSISIVSKQRACFTQKKEKSKNCTNVHSCTYACFLVIYFYMVLLENGLLLHTCFLFLYKQPWCQCSLPLPGMGTSNIKIHFDPLLNFFIWAWSKLLDVMLTFYIPCKLVSLVSEGLLQLITYVIKP